MKTYTSILTIALILLTFISVRSQSELFSNSNFDTNINSWSNSNTSTLNWEPGGYAKLTKGNGDAWNSRAGQTINNLVIGETYTLSLDITEINGNNTIVKLWNSDTQTWTSITNTGMYQLSFTATQTGTTFWWYTYGGNSGNFSKINSFSLKKEISSSTSSYVLASVHSLTYTDQYAIERDFSPYTGIAYEVASLNASGTLSFHNVSTTNMPRSAYATDNSLGSFGLRPGLPNTQLVNKVHTDGSEIYIAISGSSAFFDTQGMNTRFESTSNNIIQVMNNNNLDGVMIDLENVVSTVRRNNYITFMSVLKSKMNGKTLGYAGSSFIGTFPAQAMLDIVDFYWVMNYDMRFGNSHIQQSNINRFTNTTAGIFSTVGPSVKSSIHDFNNLQGKEKIVFVVPTGGEMYHTNTSDPHSIGVRNGYINYGKIRRNLSQLPANIVVHEEHNEDEFTDRIWHQDPANPNKFIQYYFFAETSLTEQMKLIKTSEFNVGAWSIFYDKVWTNLNQWPNTTFIDNLNNWHTHDIGTKQNPHVITDSNYTHQGDTEDGSLYFTKLNGESRSIYGKEVVYKFTLLNNDNISVTINKVLATDNNTDLVLYILDADLTNPNIVYTSIGNFKTIGSSITNASLNAGTYYILVKTLVTSKVGREGEYNLTFEGDAYFNNLNQQPTATNVMINGNASPCDNTALSYTFNDSDGDNEGGYIVTWKIGSLEIQRDTILPPNTIIPPTLTIPSGYEGQSLTATIIPIDQHGLEGNPVQAGNNLTIGPDISSTDIINACSSYTWIDGITYSNNNNTATHTLTANNGCDSIVHLELTLNTNTTTGTDVISVCSSFTWIDGNTYSTNNNTATHTLLNSAGCDSIVTLNLTITQPIYTTDNISSCNSYTWIDGNTYTSNNNTAIQTLTSASGCDSIITLNLTITQLDLTTSVNGITLSANQSGAHYQWLICNNNTLINNETNQDFSAIANGYYAVEIRKNNCIDTTDCITVNSVGLSTHDNNSIRIYPNPSKGVVNIDLANQKNVTVSLFTINGKLIYQKKNINNLHQLRVNNARGVYILQLNSNNIVSQHKVIIE